MNPDQPRDSKIILAPFIAMVFLALFPQILLLIGGGAWNGSYFISNYDETAYSAYVNSLIRGEPRKNDPFLGRSDSPETPQAETLYSIQFIPAYAIAIPARLLGIGVSTAFILLAAFIAIFSILAIYKLLLETTGDETVAAIGPVVILCLGTAVAFQGELRNLLEGRVLADFLPFLRRYQPGFAFPLFFVFCLFTWKSKRSTSVNRLIGFALAAGGTFAVLVFSYFYLWTAAAAWLGCFAATSVILNRPRRKNMLIVTGIITVVGAIAVIPYFYLLSQRSPELDSVQLLIFTRMPEFLSPSMLFGLIVAAAAIFLSRGRGEDAVSRLPLILSYALTPVILFNQQIVTGRSLQPVHYELFIANYLVLTAAMLLLSAWRAGENSGATPRFGRGLMYLGIAAFAWGIFEAYGSTSRNYTAAVIRDASIPAIAAAVKDAKQPPVILATNFVTADFVPSVGAARPLWNPHTSSAGGVDIAENKQLFYLHLYLSGFSERDLETALREESFEATAAIFGSERALPALSRGSKKISANEIRAEAASYANFVKSFDVRNAYSPTIDYIIVPTEAEGNLANLDRWYTRGAGQAFGLFRLYPVLPKAAP